MESMSAGRRYFKVVSRGLNSTAYGVSIFLFLAFGNSGGRPFSRRRHSSRHSPLLQDRESLHLNEGRITFTPTAH